MFTKRRIAISVFALVVAAGLTYPAQSQQAAGGVYSVQGQALVHHDSSAGWLQIQPGQPLFLGDSVTVAEGSRMTVTVGEAAISLHSPGQLDWVGQNGATPVLRLDQGRISIMMRDSNWNPGLALATPWGLARLEQPGSYSIEIGERGAVHLAVLDGSASVPSMGLQVMPGQMALLNNGSASLAWIPSWQPSPPRPHYYASPEPEPQMAPEVVVVPSAPIIVESPPRHWEQHREESRHDESRHEASRPSPQPGGWHGGFDKPYGHQPHAAPAPSPQPTAQPQPMPRPQPQPQAQPVSQPSAPAPVSAPMPQHAAPPPAEMHRPEFHHEEARREEPRHQEPPHQDAPRPQAASQPAAQPQQQKPAPHDDHGKPGQHP